MKIVMISDYVNPSSYTKKELADETTFIANLTNQIRATGNQFDYIEVGTLNDLHKALKKYDKKETVVFNWCEFVGEKENTAHLITEYLESHNYIFTGADTKCLLLTNSKEETKKYLLKAGILTPKYRVIKKMSDAKNIDLPYPLMLKLEDRHASIGITKENVVYNIEQMSQVAARLKNDFNATILVEEFIAGQEYTATVWGNGIEKACIYITQEVYKNKNVSQIDTEQAKFNIGSPDEKNIISKVILNKKNYNNVEKTVLKAYDVLGFSDFGRFELRERNGRYYVIDCNPNQWLGLDAVLFKGTKKLGNNYGETLLQICKFAVKRYMQ